MLYTAQYIAYRDAPFDGLILSAGLTAKPRDCLCHDELNGYPVITKKSGMSCPCCESEPRISKISALKMESSEAADQVEPNPGLGDHYVETADKVRSVEVHTPDVSEAILLESIGTNFQPKSLEASDSRLLGSYFQDLQEIRCPQVNNVLKIKWPIALEKEAELQEDVGCTVDYRCEDCHGCTKCKLDDRTREISVREAIEESLI